MRIVKPLVRLFAITPEAESLIEQCGRICYQSETSGAALISSLFIRRLVDSGPHYWSAFAHVSATFAFTVDRGVSHELVRYQLASYSQESTRYCKYDDEIAVIEPPELGDQHTAWYDACRSAEAAYLTLLGAGIKPQIARSVLPTCLKTQIAVTANLREWRHILALRCSKRAHPQIREVMLQAGRILKDECPNVFYDMEFANAD